MKPFRLLLLVALAVLLATTVAAGEPDPGDMRLLRNPDISATQIVFTHGGDLWIVPREGGEARRLTSDVGLEFQPKFSPDGRLIAFSGQYDGNTDVFVMPAEGGEPRRLTWHPLPDRVIDWEPDGATIRFQSSRTSFTRREAQLWTVSAVGGLPEPIPLPEGGLSSWSPDGKKLAYNRITREQRTWKRYTGGMAQNIWIHDFATGKTQQVTDWPGTENFPMWHGDTIYFTSDRTGRLQIWAYDVPTGNFRQVTNHDAYDVKYPSLGPDAIVYENGGWLWVLDLATEQTHRVRVALHDDKVHARPRWRDVDEWITGAGVGPDAKRVVFSARGDLFTVPREKGDVRQLTDTPDVNDIRPQWSPDGRWIAWFSDQGGDYELYVMAADGKGTPRQLTRDSDTYWTGLRWSPDSKSLLVHDAAMGLWIVDRESGKRRTVSDCTYRRGMDAAWSPDSRWIAFAANDENEFGSIFLYSLDSGKTTRVTTSFTDDGWPVFDPDGKYLFFTSARHFDPRFGNYDMHPYWTRQDGIYLVTLQADAARPFPPESDEVAVEDEDDGKKDEEDEKKKDDEKDLEVRIDLDGIGERIVPLDVPAGNYGSLSVAGGKLFYLDRGEGPQGGASTTLMLFDLEEREAETVLEDVDGYELAADGEHLLVAMGGKYAIVDAAADQQVDQTLRTDELRKRIVPPREWRQIFLDAWRLEKHFFYDPGMHGLDWKGIRDLYGQLVPFVSDRRDLDYVLGEMIAELGVGHSYVRPGDNPEVPRVGVGLLGCDFALDADSGRYRLVNILTERDWNSSTPTPLAGPGIDVREGDYLLAVDGRELRAPVNPYSLFEDKVGKQVVLTVAGRPDGKESREVTVEPIASDIGLRYVRWVEGNRRRVAELSGGRVGYIHLPNTSIAGVQAFARMYYPQLRMEGLIIDERYNSGGFIPDFIMNILRQKFVSFWKPRYGRDWRTPGTAFDGPMVMISNHHAGSGGDALPYYFQKYGLGKVVGTRTWGGLIGISRHIPLMDGGSVTFPEFRIFDTEGKWAVENHGVDPDVVVDNLPEDVAAGRDPQLEKAVELVLEQLGDRRPVPEAPPFPRAH